MGQRPSTKQIALKRVYERPAAGDGTRILVDRIWPRGLRKADAAIDHWCKDVAPSATLRKWFGHKPERWEEFRKRYGAELAEQPDAVAQVRKLAREGSVTLLFAAHDELHNNAVALKEFLSRRSPSAGRATRKSASAARARR